MDDKDRLDFLDGTPEPEEAEAPAVTEAVEPEGPERERDDRGRFAAKEPAEGEGAAPEEPQPPETGEKKASPPDAESRHVPITALLDEREKRQKLEAELAEHRRWREERERQARQPDQKAPDVLEDADGYARWQQQQTRQALLGARLEQSRFFAEREFGADLVKEAHAYFDAHPQESQQLLEHPSPFHAAVEHYKRQKFLAEVQDPDKWRDSERERLRQEVEESVRKEFESKVQSRPSTPPEPPRSLASAPSTGKEPTSPGNAFDAIFPAPE